MITEKIPSVDYSKAVSNAGNLHRIKNVMKRAAAGESITVLYGNNGCGKSTILNMIANKLNLKGKVFTFLGQT